MALPEHLSRLRLNLEINFLVYELPSGEMLTCSSCKVAGRAAFSLRKGSIRKVVTWLILPVVICLSQRLSHACLSINKFVL